MDKILFICIGNSKIIGDSLGPLVGSIILKNKNQIVIRMKAAVGIADGGFVKNFYIF